MGDDRFDRVMDAFAELSRGISECNARLTGIEATLEAQSQNVRTFWSTHWPAVTNKLDEHTADLKALREEHADTRERVIKLETNAKAIVRAEKKASNGKIAAAIAGLAAAMTGLIEGIKHWGMK